MEARLEEKPLLVNKTATTDIKLYFPKWLVYTFLTCITFLHMMSYVLSLYVTGQYTYIYFLEEKYPGAPHSLSGSLATCAINKSSIEYKVQTEIQKISAEWGIYTNLAYIIPSLLLNINLATYSDVHGRKLFFIIPLVGTVLKNIMCGVGMYYNINARLMLIFYMIEACTGVWVATLCMSFCFIADTTKPGKRRSIVIAVVEGGIGFGSLIAQFISGYIITGTNGFFYPQIIAAALAVIPLVIVLLFIEETLPESKRRTHVSIIQNMKRVFECYKPNFSQYGKRWMFIVLMLMFIMSASANISRGNVEYLYQIASPFCWDSVKIGVYGAIRTSFWDIGSVLMIAVFQLFTSDAVIALLGCVTTIASLIVEGLAQTDTMLYISAVVSFGCPVTMPMVRSIMSKMTPVDKQGSIFAGIATVESLFSLVGLVAIGAVYDATVDIYRGLTFLVWAGFGGAGVIFSLILIIGTRRQERSLPLKETTYIVEG